jgi:hypothetical protein
LTPEAGVQEEDYTKVRIVPIQYLINKGYLPEDFDLRKHPYVTMMGEFEFHEFKFDGLRFYLLEDFIELIKRWDHASLFGFLELGNDMCYIRPEHIFHTYFVDEELQYVEPEPQAEAEMYRLDWSPENLHE